MHVQRLNTRGRIIQRHKTLAAEWLAFMRFLQAHRWSTSPCIYGTRNLRGHGLTALFFLRTFKHQPRTSCPRDAAYVRIQAHYTCRHFRLSASFIQPCSPTKVHLCVWGINRVLKGFNFCTLPIIFTTSSTFAMHRWLLPVKARITFVWKTGWRWSDLPSWTIYKRLYSCRCKFDNGTQLTLCGSRCLLQLDACIPANPSLM